MKRCVGIRSPALIGKSYTGEQLVDDRADRKSIEAGARVVFGGRDWAGILE